MALLWGCICIRGAWFGTEAEADRRDEIFPLEMIYMVQNSGAPFVTLLGTSGALNLLRQGIVSSRIFSLFVQATILNLLCVQLVKKKLLCFTYSGLLYSCDIVDVNFGRKTRYLLYYNYLLINFQIGCIETRIFQNCLK